MSKKHLFILLITLIISIFIVNFFISKSYNNPENVEKRAIKYCVDNGNEYRETVNSDGQKLKQCKIDGKFIDVVQYYKSNNSK